MNEKLKGGLQSSFWWSWCDPDLAKETFVQKQYSTYRKQMHTDISTPFILDAHWSSIEPEGSVFLDMNCLFNFLGNC